MGEFKRIDSFQEPPDPELDKLWSQEAEDRLDAYDRGELGQRLRRKSLFSNRAAARQMNVTYLDAADAEFQEAVDYYNEQRAGLGFEFSDEVKRAVERIQATPGVRSQSALALLVHRFPISACALK